jgi:hypothetical protein
MHYALFMVSHVAAIQQRSARWRYKCAVRTCSIPPFPDRTILSYRLAVKTNNETTEVAVDLPHFFDVGGRDIAKLQSTYILHGVVSILRLA